MTDLLSILFDVTPFIWNAVCGAFFGTLFVLGTCAYIGHLRTNRSK